MEGTASYSVVNFIRMWFILIVMSYRKPEKMRVSKPAIIGNDDVTLPSTTSMLSVLCDESYTRTRSLSRKDCNF